MTQRNRYWLTLGILFMAFGYTADGYQAAACLFSMIAVYSAVSAHGLRSIYRRRMQILVYSSTASLLTVLTGLVNAMPAVWFVVFCAVTCQLLFEESSVRTLQDTVKWMRFVMAVLYMAVILLPYSVYGMKDTLLLITAAFLPMQLTYLHKIICIEIKKEKVRMATRPQLY